MGQNWNKIKKIKKRYMFLAIITLVACWFYWDFITPRWPQDWCEFGTVSNKDYQRIYREVKPKARFILRKIRADNPPLRDPNTGHHNYLKSYFNDVLQNTKNKDEKIAVMHAAMRAIGAWHVKSLTLRNRKTGTARYDYVYGIHLYKIYTPTSNLKTWASVFFELGRSLYPWTDLKVFFVADNQSEKLLFNGIVMFPLTIKRAPQSGKITSHPCPKF